jgi:hypothetical protein
MGHDRDPISQREQQMNEARRGRIRELIRILESAQEQVHAILVEEESAFEDRKSPSKESGAGKISEEAVRCLCEAEDGIETGIYHMQLAIGDEGLPEPVPAPIRRRV